MGWHLGVPPIVTARRGPKPERELRIARAWCFARHAASKHRPTATEIAAQFSVSRRQVELAYQKHAVTVESEWAQQIASRLTERLDRLGSLPEPVRQKHRDAREARLTYETELNRIRAIGKARRSKKKQ